MLIDWFTVAAQIVNFLILMALLKFFLYDRIIRAMDDREQKIRSRLQEAQEKSEKAAQEARTYRERQKELEERREKLMSEAKAAADSRREELEEAARREVEKRRRRWREGLEREHAAFVRKFRRMAGERALALARNILADLADADLEKQLVAVFTEGIRKLEKNERRDLRQAAAEDRQRMRVVSAFEIAADERRKVTRVLHESIAKELEVEYDTDPDLVLGVEVKVPNKKVGWSVRHYLDALAEDVQAAIRAESQGTDRREAQTPEAGKEPDQAVERARERQTDGAG